MAEATNIEWCDSTWNPWVGCTRVSPACDDCYAARSTPARVLGVAWGSGEARRRTSDANWRLPLKWQREAAEFHATHGRRRRVFCASLADWLDNAVPIQWLVDLLELIRTTPDLDWLLLTKRVGNWSSRIGEAMGYLDEMTPAAYPMPLRAWLCHWLDGDEAPRNVWLGATVIDQAEADRDVPKLLRVPAYVRFLSVEPMLGPVDLTCIRQPLGADGYTEGNVLWRKDTLDRGAPRPSIDWVICGAESGPKARPMHPDWARSLRDQCAEAGVAFLWKQWGEWLPGSQARDVDNQMALVGGCEQGYRWDDGTHSWRIGKKAAGRMLDGRTHDEWPEVPHD